MSRKSDGAQFVLKRLPLKNVPTKELATYQNEVNLLRDLSHPSIVTYIDSYQHDSHMCIVMSYCEGGDLSHFLAHRAQQRNPLPEAEILYHFVQLVLACHYMHDVKHVIHRDLKTQNVFIKNGLLQLGDLGISKALTSPTDFASTCIGTPYYMSPELFKNKPYNHKSDVWALGCILYEMCVMRHAFDANSINALASKIIRGDRAQLAGNFSPKLKQLVASMLDVNPSNRPSVKDILHLPVVKRAVRRFVHVVLRHSEFYRAKDVETLTGQVRRLGMSELIDELSAPPPLIGPPAAGAAGAVGGVGVNREAKRTLELISEEEREKQRLERKLAELRELQAEKERKVAERERRVDRPDRRRSSERARDNSAAALAADRRREEDKRRADEERRRREKERDKLREHEREKERAAREADERRRKLLELNRDRQQRDAQEVASVHRQQQQQRQQREEQSRQAAQRTAHDRVKSDRERRRREAERAEMERIRREREELNSGLREMEERASAVSEKDRVLARKEREKKEREGEERERLRAARKEYEAERAKAVEWNRAVVHGNHTPERKEREEEEEEVYEEDEAVQEEEEQERQAVEEGKARIEQLTQHLHDYSRRLQTLKTTMQVTSLIHEADDEDGEEEDDEDDEAAEAAEAALSVHLFVSIEERMRLLARECVRLMGRAMFVRLFDAVGDARDRGDGEEEIEQALQQAESKSGDERWRHWRLVDQLLFMERHNDSDEET